MNLILSGQIEDTFCDKVITLASPRKVVPIRSSAYRLEEVDEADEVKNCVVKLCDSKNVDYAFVESGISLDSFRLLAIDMDSTLISIECIDEIADFVGKREKIAVITEATMQGDFSNFSESLRQRVYLLAGTDVAVLKAVFDERLKLTKGAKNLINAAKVRGIYTLLVSGGFTYFATRLKDELGLNAAYANALEIIDDRLSGRLIHPILDAAGKSLKVLEAMHELACSTDQVLVIGDGSNDIPMMNCARHSVAFHAKPIVQAAASLQINHGDLNTVLDYYAK